MPHRRFAKLELNIALTGRVTAGIEATVTTLAGVEATARVAAEKVKKVINVKKLEAKLNKKIVGKDVMDQPLIDDVLASVVGKNFDLTKTATLATSIACARVASKVSGLELYEHLRDNNTFTGQGWRQPSLIVTLAESDYRRLLLIIPARAKRYRSSDELLQIAASIFSILGNMSEDLRSRGSGSYGGYKVDSVIDERLWGLAVKAIQKQKLKPGKDVLLGLDLNASNFYEASSNRYLVGEGPAFNQEELVSWCRSIGKSHGIQFFIDPLASDKWPLWADFSVSVMRSQLIVADRELGGDLKKLQTGIVNNGLEAVKHTFTEGSTLSESIEFLMQAQHAGLARIVSIGSNEMNDSAVVDLAYATKSEFLDIGGLFGSEHAVKYNRQLTIAKRENI